MKKVLLSATVVLIVLISPFVSAYVETDGISRRLSTHQFILGQVPIILRNDGYQQLAELISGQNLVQMKFGTMRADQTLWDSREHYMDPVTHGGFIGFKSAGQLAQERFNEAVSYWNSGNRDSAFFELGWAAHLVQDLTVPHHAALTALDYHSEYEQWVLDNQDAHAVVSGGVYNFSAYLPGHYEDESNPFDWVDYNAHFSIDFFQYVNGENGVGDNDYDYAAGELLARAQRTSAGFMLMFLSSVNVAPVADAGGNRPVDQLQPVLFNGHLSSDDMAIVNYSWDFGDGTYGYGIHATHIYDWPGDYSAVLTVRDSFGEEAIDDFFVIVRDSIPPIARAGEDIYAEVGEMVKLDASATSDNVGTALYEWTLDGVVLGSGPALNYVFSEVGVYAIDLKVEDESGNRGEDTVVVAVIDREHPLADGGGNVTLEVGESYDFDASQSTDNREIVHYYWYFGDGAAEAGKTVNHTYDGPGIYVAWLLVRDVSGNFDIDTFYVQVHEEEMVESADLTITVAVLVIAVICFMSFLTIWIHRRKTG